MEEVTCELSVGNRSKPGIRGSWGWACNTHLFPKYQLSSISVPGPGVQPWTERTPTLLLGSSCYNEKRETVNTRGSVSHRVVVCCTHKVMSAGQKDKAVRGLVGWGLGLCRYLGKELPPAEQKWDNASVFFWGRSVAPKETEVLTLKPSLATGS